MWEFWKKSAERLLWVMHRLRTGKVSSTTIHTSALYPLVLLLDSTKKNGVPVPGAENKNIDRSEDLYYNTYVVEFYYNHEIWMDT